jgi:hypothetical protein
MKQIGVDDFNIVLLIGQLINIVFWIGILFLLYKIYKKVK